LHSCSAGVSPAVFDFFRYREQLPKAKAQNKKERQKPAPYTPKGRAPGKPPSDGAGFAVAGARPSGFEGRVFLRNFLAAENERQRAGEPPALQERRTSCLQRAVTT
jgi:hypothetical protein